MERNYRSWIKSKQFWKSSNEESETGLSSSDTRCYMEKGVLGYVNRVMEKAIYRRAERISG